MKAQREIHIANDGNDDSDDDNEEDIEGADHDKHVFKQTNQMNIKRE